MRCRALLVACTILCMSGALGADGFSTACLGDQNSIQQAVTASVGQIHQVVPAHIGQHEHPQSVFVRIVATLKEMVAVFWLAARRFDDEITGRRAYDDEN